MINNKREFTSEELYILSNNKYIDGVKDNSKIIYNDNFKYLAVMKKLKNPRKSAKQIFTEFGFDMNILNDRTPQRRLCYWIKQYNKLGKKAFIKDNDVYNNLGNNDILFNSLLNDIINVFEDRKNEKINNYI